ncbi:hypothetical protein [Beijerinckia sp. L45]|uniref:hypothetical protein n=1 Tax=Beijerinckia sp. L45 TaxID=1641855 RepID=UPI001AEE9EA4|nr:hypothetical protein [Beijerinckia sp. L45]
MTSQFCLPEARSRGYATSLVGAITELARKESVSTLALVSVYGTLTLWTRLGFSVVAGSAPDKTLRPYGPAANYMTKAVA